MKDHSNKNLNIITSLCVDINDKTLNYQLFYSNNEQKRLTYWQCCITFFSTSIKCNPEAHHILYTNDNNAITHNGIDLKVFLSEIGVEIRYLPFKVFNPPKEFSRYLRLAYYKLDVLNDLCNNEIDNYNIILDSDCVWTKKDDKLIQLIKSDSLLLYDVYDREDPMDKGPHDFSRMDMGHLFKQIDQAYPTEAPIWFGGEIISGHVKNLKIVHDEILSAFSSIIKISHNPSKFTYSKKMLEKGMEFLFSFALNKEKVKWNNAKGYIKRIWTLRKTNNISADDINLTIWHMIGEKMLGIPVLCDQAINKNSMFWQIPLDKFNIYLGEYLGVPERKHKINEPGLLQVLIPKVKNKIKQLLYKFS